MNKREKVDLALSTVTRNLTARAQKAREAKEPDRAIASGNIDFLVGVLAEHFLTKKQQEQVKKIIDLYDRCLYPLAFASEQEKASSTLSITS